MQKTSHNSVDALATESINTAKKYSKITEKQWAVYYYLVSISYINTRQGETHRYIYRNQINISAASKILGIDRSTFYNALKKLSMNGLIESNLGLPIIKMDFDYLVIPLPKIYVCIPKELLTQLLCYRKSLSIDMLRTFLSLAAIVELHLPRTFTIRNIVRILGHSATTKENYDNVHIYLDLLEKWQLIRISSKIKTDSVIGKYREYTIEEIYYSSKTLKERFEDLNEMINPGGLTSEEEELIASWLNS